MTTEDFQSFKKGVRVKWSHFDRRGLKSFTGEIYEFCCDGSPYWKVRRDDTKQIVRVRTTALRLDK